VVVSGRRAGDPLPDLADEVARLSEALQGWWTSVSAGGSVPHPSVPSRDDQGGLHDDRTHHHDDDDERDRHDHERDPDHDRHGTRQHDHGTRQHDHDKREHGHDQREHGHDQREHHGDEHARPGNDQGASCRICPVCRAVDVVRTVRPELLLQVASAAETVAVLLREVAGGRPESQDGGASSDDAQVPLDRGTPIVVTDGEPPSGSTLGPNLGPNLGPTPERRDEEEGSTAWA
jgi:hypothetical protein